MLKSICDVLTKCADINIAKTHDKTQANKKLHIAD